MQWRSTPREIGTHCCRIGGVVSLPRSVCVALNTVEGAVLDSRKLHGKILMIDCWASWCAPCMRKMPELKEIHRKWHPEGLEVIGLSFDQDGQAAKAAFKRHEIPWPLVLVPNDESDRQLWTGATRIISLPRILLIDQQGVLRFEPLLQNVWVNCEVFNQRV
jgi:thiol-disulfide isomerase/thioredoxin